MDKLTNAYESTLVVLDLKDTKDFYFRNAPAFLTEVGMYEDVVSLLINSSYCDDFLEFVTSEILLRIDYMSNSRILEYMTLNEESGNNDLELFGIKLREFLEKLTLVLYKILASLFPAGSVFKVYDWPRDETMHVLASPVGRNYIHVNVQ